MKYLTPLVLLGSFISLSQTQAVTTVLVDDLDTAFTGLTNNSTVTWSTQDVATGNDIGTFVLYTPTATNNRTMADTYGGSNGVAAGTALPRGIQILAASSNITDITQGSSVTIAVTLPSNLDTSVNASFNFWANLRYNGSNTGTLGATSMFEVTNVTQSTTIRANSRVDNVRGATGDADNSWQFNSQTIDFIGGDANAGDVLHFTFTERNDSFSGQGLYLADVDFSVETIVPEPSSALLLISGGLVALGRRKRS